MSKPILVVTLLAGLVASSCTTLQPVPDTHSLVLRWSAPPMRLEIEPRFRALPPLRFPIEDLTHAERFIFVAANERGALQSMLVIQSERVQDGSEFRFVFPPTPPRRFGDHSYRFGGFAYDDERAAREAPSREAGLTRRHLVELGLKPPRYWKVARLARVSDPDGLSEVIVFYMEAIREGDFRQLSPPDESGDVQLEEREKDRLFDLLRSAVRPI